MGFGTAPSTTTTPENSHEPLNSAESASQVRSQSQGYYILDPNNESAEYIYRTKDNNELRTNKIKAALIADGPTGRSYFISVSEHDEATVSPSKTSHVHEESRHTSPVKSTIVPRGGSKGNTYLKLRESISVGAGNPADPATTFNSPKTCFAGTDPCDMRVHTTTHSPKNADEAVIWSKFSNAKVSWTTKQTFGNGFSLLAGREDEQSRKAVGSDIDGMQDSPDGLNRSDSFSLTDITLDH